MSDCVWVLQLLNSVFSSLIWLPKPSDAVSTDQLSRGQVVANSESLMRNAGKLSLMLLWDLGIEPSK